MEITIAKTMIKTISVYKKNTKRSKIGFPDVICVCVPFLRDGLTSKYVLYMCKVLYQGLVASVEKPSCIQTCKFAEHNNAKDKYGEFGLLFRMLFVEVFLLILLFLFSQ